MRSWVPIIGLLLGACAWWARSELDWAYLMQIPRSICVCIVLILLMYNLGLWISQRMRSQLDWDEAIFLGCSAVGTAVFVCWWLGVYWMITPLLLLGLWYFWQPLDWCGAVRIHWVVLLASIFGLMQALSPAVETDAVYYHLAIPQKIAEAGVLVGGYMQPNGSRPALLSGLDAWLWMLGGERSIGLFRLALGVMLMSSFLQRSKSIFGLLLLLGSYSFIIELGGTGHNIPAALGCWLTWWASRKRSWLIVGIFAGITLSIKYTTFGVLLGILLFGMERCSLRERLSSVGIVLLLLALWCARNLLDGLNPMFPYLGWSESFQSLEKYGVGRGWKDLLMLPWNILIYAETDSYRFLGALHPLWIALPFFFVRTRRRLWGVVLCGWLFFTAGPHWIRHLLPLLPLAALTCASWKPSPIQWSMTLLIWILGAPHNWNPIVKGVELQLRSVFTEQAAIDRRLEVAGWATARWASKNTPEDSRWAVLFAWSGMGLDRPFVLGSVEDHVPSREFLSKHQDGWVESLREQGVSHILVGPFPKSRNEYWFLSQAQFERRFLELEHILKRGLMTEAVLVYGYKGYSVYRLRD